MPIEISVHPPARLSAAFAERFQETARRALLAAGRFAVALPGGSVATSFFPLLSRLPLDWSAIDFFWGDERAVPPDDPESNYGLAARLWLAPAGVPARRIHRLPADAADLKGAARLAEADLTSTLGTPPRLHLALIGLGPDGHVCSLFPGHPLLSEERRFVAAIEDAPKPPPRRLTLTLPAIAASELVVVAAMGASKAEAVRAALRDPESDLPVALVTRRAPRVLFVLDEAAAALL